MYKLINNQLKKIIELNTDSQKATIEKTIYITTGYENNTPILYDSIPLCEYEKDSCELVFLNGDLVWKIKEPQLSYEQSIINAYTLELIEMGVI